MTPTTRDRLLLLTALGGFLGAAAMFAGDQLFYGHWGDGASAYSQTMTAIATRDPALLAIGGLLCIPAGLGYLAGAAHVYMRLATAPVGARWLTTLLLVAVFVLGVATHAVWGAFALTIHAAAADPALEPAQLLVRGYLDRYFLIGQGFGIPGSLLLLGLTLWGRTEWPRWTAVFNPGVLYFGLSAATWLPAPLGAAVVGGGFNLAFSLFFLMCLLVTASRRVPKTPKAQAA